MNTEKTARIFVGYFDPIDGIYDIAKPLAYVLQDGYCVYRKVDDRYWEVADVKSGIVFLYGNSLREARTVFEKGGKKRFEEWKDTHKEEYEKCCKEMEELRLEELRKEIEG